MTFTNVFMEPTEKAAEDKLLHLRRVDRFHEVKAYIIAEGDEFRVCRKIDISLPLTTNKKNGPRSR